MVPAVGNPHLEHTGHLIRVGEMTEPEQIGHTETKVGHPHLEHIGHLSKVERILDLEPMLTGERHLTSKSHATSCIDQNTYSD